MTASLQDSLAALRTTGETRLADPIAMEVFSNRLLSITEEMGNTLVRSSFSTNIKERKDCSVALFDGRGRLICQASHVPLHLGSLMGSVTAVLKACPIERMRDGDAFICNDPYLAGGTHMPDISIVTPVFIDGAVRFFAANIGHHSDVGGSVPGSISGTARSIFEEGLRIPVIRIVREGELDEDLLNLVSQNSREAEERSLDLKVQIATNERGKRLLLALANQMGLEAMTGAVDDLLAYTGRRLRNRIRDMQDGRASFVAYLDDDGVGGEPVPLQANVIVDGERLILDFTGSGPQARGAMNVAESALLATCYYVVKTLLDPELLPNSGMFSCVEVSSPAGSILNPSYPAPVGARSITCNKVARALFGAFAQLLPPERAMASSQDVVPVIIFSGQRRRDDGTFVYLESMGGGAGARHAGDGMDGIHVHITNTSNLPAEALENEYALLVDEYALVEDSGGAGRHRGGLGIARQISATRDGIVFSARSDGHRAGAPGLFGGLDGRTARLVRDHGTEQADELSSKISNLVLQAGQSVRLETPGGGGFGLPAERELASLAQDIRSGKSSRAQAERDYGPEMVTRALNLQG
ncbi:hydantoinase B/oxoprolinase family protein [Bosea sp. (in: a-proteobacteria)]|uniref:hydantoinase B/oxoprolinase family protein n=1 Tax=Bosea sp. (in: a-proteobacteria) TaxID=1871050 RepID=UPI001AC8AF13|nr:hydantoinase B/oxoprolinase family protein [Bosea sp. (in: a-proteobacteria)]MBN9442826.1 hydantoinase B/oxoprolinase family protein [Bosea sp. (in: a-proteobacteria)]